MNAFQALVNLVSGLWSAVEVLFAGIFRWYEAFFKIHLAFLTLVALLLWYFLTYFVDAVNWLGDQVPAFLAMVASGSGIGGTQIPSSLSSAFSVVNALLPLSEFFGFIVLLIPIWIISVTIRAVKSWLPTVN